MPSCPFEDVSVEDPAVGQFGQTWLSGLLNARNKQGLGRGLKNSYLSVFILLLDPITCGPLWIGPTAVGLSAFKSLLVLMRLQLGHYSTKVRTQGLTAAGPLQAKFALLGVTWWPLISNVLARLYEISKTVQDCLNCKVNKNEIGEKSDLV